MELTHDDDIDTEMELSLLADAEYNRTLLKGKQEIDY